MNTQELQKLRPAADTAAAINEALQRVAEARATAEAAREKAELAWESIVAKGADSASIRKAQDERASVELDLAQLDRLGAELAEQLTAAEAREADDAREGEIDQLEATAEAHGRAWSKDLPRHVQAIEALLKERAYLVGRAAELGRGDLVAGWATDLRPPLEQALNPASDWLFPRTEGMAKAEAEERVMAARRIREADRISEANHRLALRGFATWPADGPKVATIVVGELGRSYSVYGRSIAGGVPVEVDWPEAVRVCDVALVPATLRHPTAGALQFPGRGQASEPAAA